MTVLGALSPCTSVHPTEFLPWRREVIRWPGEGMLQNCGPECKVWARRKAEGRRGNLSQETGESTWFVFSSWWVSGGF